MDITLEGLLELTQGAQQGFALFDETDTLRFGNHFFRTILGLAPDAFPTWAELMRAGHGQQIGTRIQARDFENWLRSAQSRRGKLAFRTIESDLLDGRWLLTTETTSAQGWMLCVLTDITELGADWRVLRDERNQARKLALTDELTGLGNRRYLIAYMEEQLTPRRAIAMAAVLIDLDHFKCVNDRFGHDSGDQVLRFFANLLQSHIRREDLAGRFGGEEFLLLLPGMTSAHALETAARLLRSVRVARPFAHEPAFGFTCSAGIAMAGPGESPESLLRRADLALYQAKNAGRDRYVMAGDLQS